MAILELVSAEAVAEMAGVTVTTVRNWVRDGHLPQPMRFGRRLLRWRHEVILEWLRQKEAAARRTKNDD